MSVTPEKLKLSDRHRMMNICGISIIGHPDTGAFIGLDNEGEALIQAIRDGSELDLMSLSENQKMLMGALKESGFFTEGRINQDLKSAYFHLTSHCNLDCAGCYSYEDKRNLKPDMTLEEIKMILDNLASSGISTLIISGGEPFIRSDVVEILRYAKVGLKIKNVFCITNGIAPIETYLEASKYLDSLSFSLDAHDENSATIRPNNIFHPTIEKIRALRSEGVNATIVFTLHKNNFDSFNDMRVLADKLGVDRNFSVFSVLEPDGTKHPLALDDTHYELMSKSIKDRTTSTPTETESTKAATACRHLCGAGRTIISISSDGGVYPCHMFNGNNDFLIGSALRDNIGDILRSKRNTFSKMSVDDVEECQDCHVRYLCGGGCRFKGYATSGNANGHDKFCKVSMSHTEDTILRMSGR